MLSARDADFGGGELDVGGDEVRVRVRVGLG